MTPDTVTIAAAFAGGFVSFLSPCVLPIVPGYLSMITGADVTASAEGAPRHLGRVVRDTSLFIAGFSAVFVALGLSATTVGQVLFRNQALLTRAAGLVVLAMSLVILASLVVRSPWLYREHRLHPDLSRFGPFAAPVAGVAFGLGWTPCIGPVLTSVLALAATQEGTARGALLLAVYAAGLGVPFLLTGLAFSRLTGAFGWVKRHFTAITAASAVSLAFFGVLLVFNRLIWVTTQLQGALDSIGLGRLISLG